jgi:hypothetical protein
MMASAGKQPRSTQSEWKGLISGSIGQLSGWLEENDYRGYDTFDGLNSPVLRPLTFNNKYLRIVLQQGVRRFPFNLRPLLGIEKCRSTKGMGFLVRGFIRLHRATAESVWREKAEFALEWLTRNQASGYRGAWANHFDYQSRSSYVPSGLPSVVWTSLIGHAYLDAYEYLRNEAFLGVAVSSCEHILHELSHFPDGNSVCIGYFPGQNLRIHNANTLAAGFLARTFAHTRSESYRSLGFKALQYTAKYQRPDHSWYYGEAQNLRWVDSFHTAYVLDSFKHYTDSTGDDCFLSNMMLGYYYWKNTFFLADGTPRYYNHKTLPLDIQCCSQAIDTLVLFADRDSEALSLALKVARWTIENMQDASGYFYYRRYSRWLVNRTPTLHWGQATMLSALAALYQVL